MHQLKAEADRTEAEMQRTEDEIVSHEKGIGQLRGRLRRMGSKDSLYVSKNYALRIILNLQFTMFVYILKCGILINFILMRTMLDLLCVCVW